LCSAPNATSTDFEEVKSGAYACYSTNIYVFRYQRR
jgi:hypothetical protein